MVGEVGGEEIGRGEVLEDVAEDDVGGGREVEAGGGVEEWVLVEWVRERLEGVEVVGQVGYGLEFDWDGG